jgi:hypothetical protein
LRVPFAFWRSVRLTKNHAALQQGLQQLGWVDGSNVQIDTHWSTGNDADPCDGQYARISVEWMLSAVTCVTRGFDSFSMSGWYPAMTNRTDAKLLQVLRREIWQDRLVYLILAKCRLILSEAQAQQPNHDVQ